MAETTHALGQILLQALPTFFLVIFLYIYLNQIFFKPFARILEERRVMTEGAREAAKRSLDQAAARTGVYEASLRGERAEVYKEQEEQRRRWRDEQSADIRVARQRADQLVAEAKADLAKQAEEAKTSLGTQTKSLADEIVHIMLDRRTA